MKFPVFQFEQLVPFLITLIGDQLDPGKTVLWLVPGGSNIPLAVAAAHSLAAECDTSKLTLSLTDERFGPVGHANSNWQQLLEAGLNLPKATPLPVLTGAELESTTHHFAEQLEAALSKADYRVGLFGFGADGHTAGILPHSSAVTATELTHAYQAGPYTRITITPTAIAQLDAVVLAGTGEAKWPRVEQVLTQTNTVQDFPVAALTELPLTIFTDYPSS